MNLNCIVVDDEPMARKVLEEYIEDIDFLQLTGKAENVAKATVLLESNIIDLLFLDINMPGVSGIDFMRNSKRLPLTILTTAYTEYALEGFELDVVDYLVKPFSFERFAKATAKAKEYFELKNKVETPARPDPAQNYFFVKCEGVIEKVFYDELLYVEAMLNYVVLHTESRKMMVYHTIKGIYEQLPPGLFLRIHKSTVVNKSKVKSIDGNELDLGKTKVYISQNLYEEVLKEILKDRMLKR
jgi:DNA-binding LytR/AlgR family response regulator